ncbi:TIGR03086 family metal-binding protein [Pseudonocardia abyssalis]|uniref:TIGR03086 family protein n=2 Tax=Pseudonocardia abyssalis TaxID=2792008 RepID=A0ABS6UXX9_9PSEU|nr:TIGR03086 family metal-binding protein [Pseudonocardia abyssalis]MBW0137076.1 TIGR03086 family protein [Pseudonocardia abyssalis]
MSDQADRYRRIAAGFTRRVEAVPAQAWDAPAPCEGWVARDVVRHLVEWLPGFFVERWGLDAAPIPSVDDDPAAAWAALDALLRTALADPAVADAERDTPMGRNSFAATLDMIGTTDVFLHTWDLARATGGDERLDPDEVHRLYEGMLPLDEMLRTSGHYGPRVPVPDDVDEQTKLLAFIGRTP